MGQPRGGKVPERRSVAVERAGLVRQFRSEFSVLILLFFLFFKFVFIGS